MWNGASFKMTNLGDCNSLRKTSAQRTPDQVVQVVMASWPTCASFTRESVESFGVGHYSAWTLMWFADVGTQPQTNSDVYRVVVQTQSTCWERQCVQPVTAMWRPYRLHCCHWGCLSESHAPIIIIIIIDNGRSGGWMTSIVDDVQSHWGRIDTSVELVRCKRD